jgi:hypothetical protein
MKAITAILRGLQLKPVYAGRTISRREFIAAKSRRKAAAASRRANR